MNGERKVKFAAINKATLAEHTIVAAVANKRIRVINYTLIADALVDATWKSNTTALTGPLGFPANGGCSPQGDQKSPQFETAAGEALVLSLTAAVQVSGHLAYVEVS